jgi:hypothetical protein
MKTTTTLPEYVSHKHVWAAQIKAVKIFDIPEGSDSPVEGKITKLAVLDLGEYGYNVEVDYANRPVPEAGMYYVKYEDGYHSFSPANVFENGYSLNELGYFFDFGVAIQFLKAGKLVARKGWNGKGMFLYYVPASKFIVNRAPLLGIFPEGTEINHCAWLGMKTADGKFVPWLASQTDMLAEDWEVVT